MGVTGFAFEAIGTHWKIEIEDTLSTGQRDSVLQQVLERIQAFDRDYSRFRADSLVAEMSLASGTYHLPPDAEPMFRLYQEAYQLTEGAVTPLIGQVLVDAGYDATYSLISRELHHPPSWEEVMDFQAPQTLVMKRPVLLDVGAFGKGYLIDIVAALLVKEGVQRFCIDAGGDVLHRDSAGGLLRVGLENPLNTNQVIGVATISNRSICGSAGNRRAWGTYHHIINPHTLMSPRDIVGTWAAASTTLLADAMATCLFFANPDTLLRYYSFDYLVMYADTSVTASQGFPQELFGARTR